MKVTLRAQIEELEYEAGMRRDVHGRLVASGKMRQAIADLHKMWLEAAIATLKWLSLHEAKIRAAVEGEPEARG